MSAKHGTIRLKSIETLAFALVFVFFSGIEFSKAHEHSGYSHDSDTGVEYPDWMGDLPDDMRLSEMSLPGTHDTMAYKVSDSSPCSLPIAKGYTLTQSMDLKTQLDAGIRVLDIRARHIDDAFAMHHGPCYLSSNFDDVLSEARDFLTDHPTETVLMRVKPEHTEENVTRDFEDTFVEYMNDYGIKFFWNPSNSNNPTNPTLGELRGKIVILQQFKGTLYGLDYSDPDVFTIQDNYKVPLMGDLYARWLAIKFHLILALDDGWEPGKIFINYLSGTGGPQPWKVASGHLSAGTSAPRIWTGKLDGPGYGDDTYPDFPRLSCFLGTCSIYYEGTNILTTNYLVFNFILPYRIADEDIPSQRVGMIISDFPGSGLIGSVIAMNGVKNKLPPTADAGGPYSVDEGSPVTLNASASTDPDGDALTYRWDFDSDGSYDTSSSDSPTISHTWNDDQEVTVTVEVSDGEFVSTAQASVTVSNVAPSITSMSLGSSSIDEGQSVTVSGSFDDPALGSSTETFSGSATWSDGTTTPLTVGSGTFSTGKTFPDDHPSGTSADEFTVTISLSDDDGGSDTRTSPTLTVRNVAPANLILSATPIDENGDTTLSISFVDPGVSDTFTLAIDWGDPQSPNNNQSIGLGASRSATLDHRYLDDNPSGTSADDYTISVTLTDDDTGTAMGTGTVTVDNVAPVASIDSVVDPLTGSAIAYLRDGDVEVSGDIDVVLAGSTIEVQGSYTDTGPLDTHAGSIVWDDGTGEVDVGLSPAAVQNESGGTTDPVGHAYGSGLAPGARVIELTITDDDSGSGTSTAGIEVVDAAGALAALLDDIQEVIDGDDPNPAAELALYEALHAITGNPSNEVGGDGDGDAENGAMDHLERGNLNPTLVKIRHAIQYLQAAETADAGLDVEAVQIQLTLIVRSIARGSIDEANELAGRKGEFRRISRAEALMADGDTHLSGGDFLAAVDDYAAAVRMVENLLNAKPGRSLRPGSPVRAAAIP